LHYDDGSAAFEREDSRRDRWDRRHRAVFHL